MSLWLRVRRLRPIAVVTVLVSLIALLLGGLIIPLPSLGSLSGLRIPIALIAPLAVAVTVAWGLSIGAGPSERAAVRPIDRLDASFVAAIAGVTAVLLAAGEFAGVTTTGYAAARNALGYVGLMLLGRWLLGSHAASVVPVGWILLIAAFGSDGAGEPRWWVWPLLPWQDALSWAFSLAIFLTGLALAASDHRFAGTGVAVD